MANLNELYKTLVTLSEHCDSTSDCRKCPFYVGDKVGYEDCFFRLQIEPCHWDPENPLTTDFRFF